MISFCSSRKREHDTMIQARLSMSELFQDTFLERNPVDSCASSLPQDFRHREV